MEERDIPLLNEPEGEIAFTGYGVKDDNDDMYAYADQENIPEFSANVIESEMENTNCNSGETYLRNNNSPNRDLADITIVAHGRPSSFWRLLFKQNLDASLAFKVIWAGETASDDGGPFREFLVRTMDFGELKSHFFGEPDELMFNSLTDNVIRREYYLLGQLCGLAILNIDKGPQCLHPAIVDVIFSLPRKCQISNVIHGEYEYNVKEIRSGNKETLYSAQINPTSDVETDIKHYKEYFCVLSRLSGIDQFRQGIVYLFSIRHNSSNNYLINRFFLIRRRQTIGVLF